MPADFEVALQGVDTRLKALQPGTTLGDIAYSSATANTNTRLPIGTSGQVLAVSGGGVPAWTTTADVTPLTTKGDLFTFDTADARLGVGTNGQTLVADSTASTGLKWATPATPTSGLTLIRTASFSAVTTTTTSFDTLFSGTYSTYQLVFSNMSGSSNGATLRLQFRKSAATQSAASYRGVSFAYAFDGTLTTALTANSVTTGVPLFTVPSNANVATTAVGYVSNIGIQSNIHGTYNNTCDSMTAGVFGGVYQVTDTQDGFILSASAGTITGTVKIYGLAAS